MALSEHLERWFPGPARVVAWRMLSLVLAMLPTALIAFGVLKSGPALRPYYTDPANALTSLIGVLRLARELSLGVPLAMLAGVLFALVSDLFLTAGAIAYFSPELEPPPPSRGVLGWLLGQGAQHFWPLCRIALLVLLLFALGALGIRWSFHQLAIHGWRAGWTGYALEVELRALKALAFTGWLALVGTFGFWCRVITVADGRRRVRRIAWLVLRVWARHPIRGPLSFIVLNGAPLIGTALIVLEWRQAAPDHGAAMLVLGILWLGALTLQALVWQVLVRGARLLYDAPGLIDLRAVPDLPRRSLHTT